jgi:hypothetical protein
VPCTRCPSYQGPCQLPVPGGSARGVWPQFPRARSRVPRRSKSMPHVGMPRGRSRRWVPSPPAWTVSLALAIERQGRSPVSRGLSQAQGLAGACPGRSQEIASLSSLLIKPPDRKRRFYRAKNSLEPTRYPPTSCQETYRRCRGTEPQSLATSNPSSHGLRCPVQVLRL